MTGFRRGWLHLASGASVGRLFGFVGNLLLSRWLGPADLGLFNLVSTTVQTGDTLVRCGADFSLNYELGGQPEAIHSDRGIHLARAFAQLCTLTTGFFCIGTTAWIWWGQGLFPLALTPSQRSISTFLIVLMIFSECISAPAWELLLVSHRTSSLALRQGLFFPLRLLLAAVGGLFGGVTGAMTGWSLTAFAQCLWLKTILGRLWRPFHIWPLMSTGITQLLSRGMPFYVANLLASIIFYPLLLHVASASGLSQIGYLRAGQILQQIFAFVPATLAPVLFLRLRGEATFPTQVRVMERPLRIIWLVLLELLLLYCIFDQNIIITLFGKNFAPALLPTRLLLLTALFECLFQLLVQPILAAGHTRAYGYWQNGSAIFSAVIGWLWIPSAGITAYLIVRLLYVIIPLVGLGMLVFKQLLDPPKILVLLFVSILLLTMLLLQSLSDYLPASAPVLLSACFVLTLLYQKDDVLFFLKRITVKT